MAYWARPIMRQLDGRMEMFYLMTHSTHFMINAYISVENGILSKTDHASVGWKNGNVLFNDTLNTFYD